MQGQVTADVSQMTKISTCRRPLRRQGKMWALRPFATAMAAWIERRAACAPQLTELEKGAVF